MAGCPIQQYQQLGADVVVSIFEQASAKQPQQSHIVQMPDDIMPSRVNHYCLTLRESSSQCIKVFYIALIQSRGHGNHFHVPIGEAGGTAHRKPPPILDSSASARHANNTFR